MTQVSLFQTLNSGQRALLLPQGAENPPSGALLAHAAHSFWNSLRAGQGLALGGGLVLDGGRAFTVLRALPWPGGDGSPAQPCALVRAEADLEPGRLDLELLACGRTLAWVTLSDKASRGERQDTAGPLMAQLAGEALDLEHAQGYVLPDDVESIKALLTDLALAQRYDLVLTSGGTGLAPRDLTPEATLAVIEKRLPGLERAMTLAGLAKTPHAALSRAVAGTLGQCLVINLPGSPKAVREGLEAVLPALAHGMDKLAGDPADCAAL